MAKKRPKPGTPREVSDAASKMSLARRHFRPGPGRPRTKAPRCPCGAMTAKLAKIKRHECTTPVDLELQRLIARELKTLKTQKRRR